MVDKIVVASIDILTEDQLKHLVKIFGTPALKINTHYDILFKNPLEEDMKKLTANGFSVEDAQ